MCERILAQMMRPWLGRPDARLRGFLARRSLPRGWRSARNAGSAAVEFAITAPLLVALALGAADYGDLANRQATLEAATRAGAEYARATPGDAPSWTNTKSTVTSFTSFSPAATPTVSVVCTCVDNSPAPGSPAGTTPPVRGRLIRIRVQEKPILQPD
jgi:Flp pilus assembly protein TadG